MEKPSGSCSILTQRTTTTSAETGASFEFLFNDSGMTQEQCRKKVDDTIVLKVDRNNN